jgi:hypothetical protein
MIPSSSGPTVTVSGRVVDIGENERLTINGDGVDVAGDGSFSRDITPEVGANVIVAQLTGGRNDQRAQRSFLYGEFAPPDEWVDSAAALRINMEGYDDTDQEVDDMSSLLEASLAERNLMTKVPASYSINAPVVGNVDVDLTERRSGDPRIDLIPHDGGVHARVTLPNVRIRHRVSFSCAITTCSSTGTATADAVIVEVELDMALEGQAITAASRDATFDLVNFRNDQDGTLGSLAQSVVEYFVPDLEQRIEDMLRPAVAQAARADFALAVGQLAVPATVDFRPALDAQVTIEQRFDALEFSETGSITGLGLRATAPIEAGDPGEGAPGWVKLGGTIGDYRTDPPFGVSSAVDLFNQMLFAAWAQGGLAYDLPDGTIPAGGDVGAIHVTALAPPVVVPQGEAGALRMIAGDVVLDTTMNGEPLQIVCTILADARLSVDAERNVAVLELNEDPVIYAEMVKGPDDLPGTFFSTMVEELGPGAIGDLVGRVPMPLPTVPLDGVADSLAGKQLRIAPPAEVVTGEPPARVTLYGRFAAQ